MKHAKFLSIALLITAMGLSACWGDGEDVKVENSGVPELEIPRQLKINCDDWPCTDGPVVNLKLSDYDPAVITWAGITNEDTEETFLRKVHRGPEGVGTYSHGSVKHLSHEGRRFLLLQKSDFDNPYRDQYDIIAEFETTENDDGKIIIWGGRIQCSTVADKSVWQTTSCPEPDFLFERQWFECVNGNCVRSTEKAKFRENDFNKALIDWVDLSGPISPYDFGKKLLDTYGGESRGESGSARNYPASYNIAHLHAGENPSLNEYEVFYIARNQKVTEWGARVRCAPVTETTPWQTTPC